MLSAGGIVQLGEQSSSSTPVTVLGQNEITSPAVVVESVPIPEQETTGSGTLTQAIEQPKTVNRIPTWIIILVALLGSVIVFGVLGIVIHKIGKHNRNKRARRWASQQAKLQFE